jgi:hypothetical protein
MRDELLGAMNTPAETSAIPSGSLAGAMLRGAVGFAVVSIVAFSVWAFGSGLFRGRGGEPVLYAAIAVVFLGLTGLVMHPLVEGDRKLARFYAAFVPAFLLYAIVWSGFWFWLKFGLGEWLGAAAGSLVFVAYTAWRLGQWKSFWIAAAVFFVLHTAGYFAGGWCTYKLLGAAKAGMVSFLTKDQLGVLAKLSWGLFYGLGFGGGLGYAYRVLQRPVSVEQ